MSDILSFLFFPRFFYNQLVSVELHIDIGKHQHTQLDTCAGLNFFYRIATYIWEQSSFLVEKIDATNVNVPLQSSEIIAFSCGNDFWIWGIGQWQKSNKKPIFNIYFYNVFHQTI